jgi:hypothetical protein
MVVDIIKHSIMITSFVFSMMLMIEYINVQTKGSWQENLKNSRWRQYILSVILGATPGCLGAFTVVSLYSHRVVSFGALVATMIATSGDEAYVMLSLFPGKTIILTIILIVVALIIGYLTDAFAKNPQMLLDKMDHQFEIHEHEVCDCLNKNVIIEQLKKLSLERGALLIMLSAFMIGFLMKIIGPPVWNWVKITYVISFAFGLFIVLTVPEHFLEEHLWEHIFKKHLFRIFLWTFGALYAVHMLESFMNLEQWIQSNTFTVLGIASLVGMIPESGPNLIFVTLFAKGALPFGILVANSIVQDGHGTLPLLAFSGRAFLIVKIINIAAGLLVGAMFLLAG